MPIEYNLLCLLAKNIGRVLTHQYILDKVWVNSIESVSYTHLVAWCLDPTYLPAQENMSNFSSFEPMHRFFYEKSECSKSTRCV